MNHRTFSLVSMLLVFSGCATGGIPTEELRPYCRINLQYPVVLAHGIGRNEWNGTKSPWGRIPEILQEYGVEVYYGNTDAWGDIKSNAELLKETIDKILEKTNKEKVNIIAHSKGGIDSRFLIWNYDYGDKIASLTTLATPHRGSEIADLLYSTRIIHTKMARNRLSSLEKRFKDNNPDIYRVTYELTTENMGKFNETVTPDDRVYYQSIYTVMNSPSTDRLFSRSFKFIQSVSGNNDGLVSEYSARWGPHIIKIADSISHEQIIGNGGKKIPGMKIPNIYLDIVLELMNMGF